MNTPRYNNLDIKQLLDIISKGVNSVLMTKPDTPPEQLKALADALLEIYSGILDAMKNQPPTKSQELNFPEDEEL